MIGAVITPKPPGHYCPKDFPELNYTDTFPYKTLVSCSECHKWWFVTDGEWAPQYKKVRWYHYRLQARISERMV